MGIAACLPRGQISARRERERERERAEDTQDEKRCFPSSSRDHIISRHFHRGGRAGAGGGGGRKKGKRDEKKMRRKKIIRSVALCNASSAKPLKKANELRRVPRGLRLRTVCCNSAMHFCRRQWRRRRRRRRRRWRRWRRRWRRRRWRVAAELRMHMHTAAVAAAAAARARARAPATASAYTEEHALIKKICTLQIHNTTIRACARARAGRGRDPGRTRFSVSLPACLPAYAPICKAEYPVLLSPSSRLQGDPKDAAAVSHVGESISSCGRRVLFPRDRFVKFELRLHD